ncbi:protein EURL homolog [Denticeps clupeoides]|uniref:Protein EURL homolog n=1 Tax=Denticeps clupeoides TaxID=299321 RepID=A0AAY4AGV4_9TELE|nr:protein EURL homolog [Denticeps clupeoides]XP_028840699.1 protein EURL homolog [Denticeps clupeoides]XP_028840700.1 protein EURL homolog [Denticeps clupeoides]XP_028840701.1 protein EURL homolog [Denticeps clupeoides]XP_028840702.1 protein EURL homolog [Denticeps clupeoides]XP_028840703.1 protein EURL homolog [Denticeps clupeoides]
MDEEEQFVNIDLNDDNICSVCKLETDTGTLSFCHICFELSIEGVCSSTLLHSRSLRGHRDCFEKYHLIANQKLSSAKSSRSAYEGVKRALSQRLSRIVQYAQNKDTQPAGDGLRGSKHQLWCYSQPGQGDRKLLPQSDSQVPRYAPSWNHVGDITGEVDCTKDVLGCNTDEDEDLRLLQEGWEGNRRVAHWNTTLQTADGAGVRPRRHPVRSQEELLKMSLDELHQLNGQLRLQIQKVFEELTEAVQEKDSLASELHVRHIAIEQLFKNCAKLPWLQVGRAGVKAGNAHTE